MIELFKYLKEKENREIPLVIRVKENLDLYYKDKSRIKDKEVLKILDKSYEWLYNFLGDLEKRKVNSDYYDFKYYKDGKVILAYDKKNDANDIDYDNFYSIFNSYMDSYLNDNEDDEILIHIIQGYLVNTLRMEGSRTWY